MKTFPACNGCRMPPGNYPETLTSKLNSQRLEGKHCDVTLIHGSQRFPVHSGVLCAASDYFASLLDGNFTESGQNSIDITESISNAEALETVLQYIYTGKLDIQETNFEYLLESVHFLMLDQAVKLMTDYLVDSLVLENCIQVLMLSSKFCIEELVKLSSSIVKARLGDYLFANDREKLLALSPDLMRSIASGFCHLTTEETISFLKEYFLDLLHDKFNYSEEHVKSLLFSSKALLIAIKECMSDEGNTTNFCAQLIDILSGELIEESPQLVREKFCTQMSVPENYCAGQSPMDENDNHDKGAEVKHENIVKDVNEKEGRTEENEQNFEETIVVRTQELHDNGKTKFSFYAYLTHANKWVEITEPDPIYQRHWSHGGRPPFSENLEKMRFIGYSRGSMVFTPKNDFKHKKYSACIVALSIIPDPPEFTPNYEISGVYHLCLNRDFDPVEFPGICCHHVFTSGNGIFCVFPDICCRAASRHKAYHRAEIGAYKVQWMDWEDTSDPGCAPVWHNVGTLDMPETFKKSTPSYCTGGNFQNHVLFFTTDTPSCSYILACRRMEYRMTGKTPGINYAVFKMSHGDYEYHGDGASVQFIVSGVLSYDNSGHSTLELSQEHFSLAATDDYLILYSVDQLQFDSWKIQVKNINPVSRFRQDVSQDSHSIRNGDEKLPQQDDSLDYSGARVSYSREMSIHTITSNRNGHLYVLENNGPFVTSMTRCCPGALHAAKRYEMPPPPVDRVFKEVTIALAPKANGLAKNLQARPKMQFQTRFGLGASWIGPYHPKSGKVETGTDTDSSDQSSDTSSDVSDESLM